MSFASLQSKSGQEFSAKYNVPIDDLSSVIYLKDGKYYRMSSAILHALNDLGGIWKAFFILMVIPRPIRDFFYKLIARNRYRLFGKRANCMIPTKELKAKFLD